jgi:hypothetical protein
VGCAAAATAATRASLAAPRGGRSRWRGAPAAWTAGHGQLVDPRAAEPGQAAAESESRQLPEQSRARRAPADRRITTTKRGIRLNSAGKAEGATMGEVEQSSAKCTRRLGQAVFVEDGLIRRARSGRTAAAELVWRILQLTVVGQRRPVRAWL